MTPDRPKIGPKSPQNDAILVPKWPNMALDRVKNNLKTVKKGQKLPEKKHSKAMYTFMQVHKKHSKSTQDASRHTH